MPAKWTRASAASAESGGSGSHSSTASLVRFKLRWQRDRWSGGDTGSMTLFANDGDATTPPGPPMKEAAADTQLKPIHPSLEVQGKWRGGLIFSEPFAKAMLVILHYVYFVFGGFDRGCPLLRFESVERLHAEATNTLIGDGPIGHVLPAALYEG
jgi:hypothetical protein